MCHLTPGESSLDSQIKAGSPAARQRTRSLRGGAVISGGGEEVCGGGVLLGANGAGKTACFYVIAGLVKPDSGRVLMKGEEVTKLPMHRLARLGLS